MAIPLKTIPQKQTASIPADDKPLPHEIGTNTLLFGEVGSGKTSALPTFIAAGLKHDVELKLAVVLTEPGGVESLLDAMELHAPPGERSLPMDRLHYSSIAPASTDWRALIDMGKKINMMGYKDLAELKSGLAKEKHKQYLDLLSLLANFKNQHGESIGAADKLDNTWLVAVDSITGVSQMARQLAIGLKPSPHQGEWNVMMSAEEALINQLVNSTNCFTCITGHIDREMDEVLGKPQYTVALLGRKLAPRVPRMFSDVILQVRDMDKFAWSTIRRDYSSLKARNVRLADNLPPTFEQIYKHWLQRKEKAEAAIAVS